MQKIKKNNENNVRFSLKDSEGNELTAEQQDYFKDSKVRDSQGNLQVVYHGSRNAIFSKFGTNLIFFSNSKLTAKQYAGGVETLPNINENIIL